VKITYSYEEKIINALYNLDEHDFENVIAADKAKFDAIRKVLQPLYEELELHRSLEEKLKGLL
jgi:hypothetical protein